jgi:hypothetical protein
MKKKLFGSIAALAIAAMAAINVNISTQEDRLSDVSLNNIEALAQEASGKKYYQSHCGSRTGTQCQSTLTGPSCPNQASCP